MTRDELHKLIDERNMEHEREMPPTPNEIRSWAKRSTSYIVFNSNERDDATRDDVVTIVIIRN